MSAHYWVSEWWQKLVFWRELNEIWPVTKIQYRHVCRTRRASANWFLSVCAIGRVFKTLKFVSGIMRRGGNLAEEWKWKREGWGGARWIRSSQVSISSSEPWFYKNVLVLYLWDNNLMLIKFICQLNACHIWRELLAVGTPGLYLQWPSRKSNYTLLSLCINISQN